MTTSADLPAQEPTDGGQAPDEVSGPESGDQRRDGLLELVDRLAEIRRDLLEFVPPVERDRRLGGQDNDEILTPDLDAPPEGDDA